MCVVGGELVSWKGPLLKQVGFLRKYTFCFCMKEIYAKWVILI